MSKKLFFAALVLLMGLSPKAWAFAVNTANGIPLYYTVNSDGTTVTLTGHGTPCSGALVIPDSVTYEDTTYAVTRIGASAFSGCHELTSVTFPATITEFAFWATNNCTFTETHFMGTVEQWLSINIPSIDYASPVWISKNFYLGDSLVTRLIIPEGVDSISHNFCGDTALTYISIPSTATYIAANAFHNCAPNWFRFHSATPPTLGFWDALTYNVSGQNYGSYMMVPWQSLQAYKTATNYTAFAQNLIYPDSCMLSVNVNNPDHGTVTLDGGSTLSHLYQLLDTATISVSVLNANYSYEITADGCTIIDTINTNTYKVRFNRSNAYPTFTVDFIGNTHHVNAVANCAGCGAVTGTNDYAYGSTVTVEATPADGYYFVRWADGSTANPATFVCTGDTTVTAIFSDIVTPELCMVSVQDDRNVLLWEREDKPIVSYTVYREGTVSGEYDAVATIPYAQAGEWTDDDSRPSSRSYRYRLTATDTCGNESEAGGIHKTMHLTISQGVGNTWNLVWTPYEGADYTTYIIYRGTSAADIQQIDIMPSAGNTTYSDNNAPEGAVYYQVGVMMTTPCGQSTKSGTISLSNIASSEGGTEGIEEWGTENGEWRTYVVDGRIFVDIPGNADVPVRIYDMMGRMQPTTDCQLPTGIYMVKVGNRPTRKVVVMN